MPNHHETQCAAPSATLTDERLFSLCRMYGTQALEARRKFLGLLPEVNRRRLYEKKGFSSIFVFAFRLAGVSEEQVRRVLNLERRFRDKPMLQSLLINGEVSMNKLVHVAAIATPENQEELADKLKLLPKSAIETLARDVRRERDEAAGGVLKCHSRENGNPESLLTGSPIGSEMTTESGMTAGAAEMISGNSSVTDNLDAIQKPLFDCKSVPGNTQTSSIDLDVKLMATLDAEVKSRLMELSQKGIDINDLIIEMLKNREVEIARTKEQISTDVAATTATKASRNIHARVIRVLRREYGKKCSIPNCPHDAKTIHHTQRFAVSRAHDPHFLAPLCHEHHLLAHAADTRFWERRRGVTYGISNSFPI